MKNLYKLLTASFLVLTLGLLFSSNSFALIYPYNLVYSGANEVPPNASPATGSISGTYDDVTNVITVNISFSGLIGNTTAAHFHAPALPTANAPVVQGYTGFPTGVTNGVYVNSFVLSPASETNLFAGLMYSNIHSNVFPGGEIRVQMSLDAPLPVELSSFISVVNGSNVTLNWSTASEINNSGFEIERKSTTSNEWTRAGFVAGNGTISTTSNYSFSEVVTTGLYNYRLKQIDFNGNYEYFNLANEVSVGIPSTFSLSQNYPNPFNPSTRIEYAIPTDGKVSIILYNMSGKEVSTLVNENKTAGYYNVSFNASGLSSGVYFYTITSGNFVDTKRMVLVK